jgi:hypothetical protein
MLAEALAAIGIVASYRLARSVRLVLREKVGRDEGRGRKNLGFMDCGTRGHAEPLEVPADVVPHIESCAIEPPPHAGAGVRAG